MLLLIGALTDLAHRYGLPMFGTAGYTDAKCVDQQAGAEAAISYYAAALSGANLVHDTGLMDHAELVSAEMMVFCDEIISWLRRYLRKLEISEESLALDLIHEVGADGHFLEAKHTLRHVREDWIPTVSDRCSYHRWAAEGATTLQRRANQRVREIIESHRAEPLSTDVAQAVQAIVEGKE